MHEVPTFHICNKSSKVFLSKPHTKTEETKLPGRECDTY